MLNDDGKIGKLIAQWEQSLNFRVELIHALAPEVSEILQRESRSKQGPSGEKWPKTKKGRHMRIDPSKYIKVEKFPDRIEVTLLPPATYHQTGTKYMPARPMIPGGEGLPPKWSLAFRKVANKVVKKVFKGEEGDSSPEGPQE